MNWAAIAAAALCLRLGYILRQPPIPMVGDALEYHSYAVSLLDSGRYEGIGGARAARMPGYPVFLSAVYAALGRSMRAVQTTQCLLGALSCLLIYSLGTCLLKPPWPLACGLAAACYFDLIAPSGALLTEALFNLLLTAALCALYRGPWSGRRRAALGGLGLGLTALVRPEILPLAALILFGLPFLMSAFTRRQSLLALVLFLTPVSLWAVRNALIFHRLVPLSTVGGFNVYTGLRLPLEHQSLDLGPIHRPPDALGELARDADFLEAYRALCRRVSWPRKLKAYAFNLLSVYYPFLPDYDWTYAVLVPFWAAGFCWSFARREWWPFSGLVIGLSALYSVLSGPVSRYRFGLAPLLILLAGHGAQKLREKSRGSKAFYGLAGGWAAVNVAVWVWAPTLRQAVLRMKAVIWN